MQPPRGISVLGLLAVLCACHVDAPISGPPGGKGQAAAPDGNRVPTSTATAASITLSPRFVGMQVGKTRATSVVIRDANGIVIGKPVTYSVADATVASVSAAGVVTGLKAGGTTYMYGAADAVRDSVAVSVNSVYGLESGAFGPYVDGQSPDLGTVITEAQVRQRLLLARPYLRGVRTFGLTRGLEFIPRVAREMNLQVACGAWIGKDPAANALEVASLVAEVNAGRCRVAIVGSEVLLRGDATEAQLIGYINQVRAQRTNATPVTTADVHHVWLNSVTLRAAVDEIWVNIYPYHEGTHLRYAPAVVHGKFNQLKALAAGKRTVLSETGWPSCGATNGAAVPSVANLVSYFRSVISWSRATGNTVSYFEVFDESWKAVHGAEQACFGFLTKDGLRKQGVGTVFAGNVVADTWTLPGGPGTPTLLLTHVPPRGSTTWLEGQVEHLNTSTHQVAFFIRVNGLYWNKPTFAMPAVPIDFSGSFSGTVTSNPSDVNADQVVVYVLPTAYAIPLLYNGSATLPASLDANAVAKAVVNRP